MCSSSISTKFPRFMHVEHSLRFRSRHTAVIVALATNFTELACAVVFGVAKGLLWPTILQQQTLFQKTERKEESKGRAIVGPVIHWIDPKCGFFNEFRLQSSIYCFRGTCFL